MTTETWQYPELPTLIPNGDYDTLVKEIFKNRSEWLNGENWTKVSDRDGCTLEELLIPGSNFPAYRTVGVLNNVDIKEIARVSFNGSYEEKKRTQDDMISITTTRQINENTIVTLARFSTPFGVTNREFLSLKSMRWYDDGSCFIVIQSVNDEQVPFGQGYVRGVGNCCVYLRPVNENDVQIININHVDPKGWVPSFLINRYKERQYDDVVKIQQVFGK